MDIERSIAMHCGPTLAGIKPANILSISKAQNSDMYLELEKMNMELNGFDIFFDVLCECKNRLLVIVYHKKNLYDYINRKEIAELLNLYGYPSVKNLDDCIEFLKYRISTSVEFPHEIGAFLGYPVCDIYGFIKHKNEGCKYTGYWKVYDNVEDTKRLFSEYDCCRNKFIKLMNNGAGLIDLVCAS